MGLPTREVFRDEPLSWIVDNSSPNAIQASARCETNCVTFQHEETKSTISIQIVFSHDYLAINTILQECLLGEREEREEERSLFFIKLQSQFD